MAKILQSRNFIKYIVSCHIKTSYLKNGGAYMKSVKIFQEEKQNLFDELLKFLETQESQSEKNEAKEEEAKEQEKNVCDEKIFEKEFLKTKLLNALNSFDILKAERIKETLNNLESNNQAYDEHENKTCCDEEMLQCQTEQSSAMED